MQPDLMPPDGVSSVTTDDGRATSPPPTVKLVLLDSADGSTTIVEAVAAFGAGTFTIEGEVTRLAESGEGVATILSGILRKWLQH